MNSDQLNNFLSSIIINYLQYSVELKSLTEKFEGYTKIEKYQYPNDLMEWLNLEKRGAELI